MFVNENGDDDDKGVHTEVMDLNNILQDNNDNVDDGKTQSQQNGHIGNPLDTIKKQPYLQDDDNNHNVHVVVGKVQSDLFLKVDDDNLNDLDDLDDED